MDKPVRLPQIFSLSQYLQIPRHVQTTHQRTLQRHDMVNVVPNASRSSLPVGFNVERHDGVEVGPFRRGGELCGVAPGDFRVYASWVSACPSNKALSQMFFIALPPLTHVLQASVFVRLEPLLEAIRILCAPLTKVTQSMFASRRSLRLSTRSTLCFTAWIEVLFGLELAAVVAEAGIRGSSEALLPSYDTRMAVCT